MIAFKRFSFLFIFIIFQTICSAQEQDLEKLGYRTFSFKYKDEIVNILVKSKLGEEDTKKPLIIYFQGSLARPLIINYPQKDNFKYSLAFPFDTEKIIQSYHIAVISKPFIPVVANVNDLDENYNYIDSLTKKPPVNFLKNDNLEYIADRNVHVLKFIKKELPFIEGKKFTLIGHSEGSRIAYEVTKQSRSVSRLIYLSGNPFGRYMTILQRKRRAEGKYQVLEKDDAFDYWKKIAKNKDLNNYEEGGDTYKSSFAYSQPYFNEFLKFRIPVYIGYGTKDDSSAFNDLFYFYSLLAKKKNFFVKPFIGLEHSFYKVNDQTVDYESPYWDFVIDDVMNWLEQNKTI